MLTQNANFVTPTTTVAQSTPNYSDYSWAQLHTELMRLMGHASRATRGRMDDPDFGRLLAKRDKPTLDKLTALLHEIESRD
jgi:hypothetical protein